MKSREEIEKKWAMLMTDSDRLYEYDDIECIKLSKEYALQAKILRWVLED